MERLRPWLPWLVAVGILILIAIPCILAFQFYTVARDFTASGISRVGEMADSVSTQVANVLHPTPTIIPDPVTIIHQVRSLARLETIQYSVEKIITAESGQGLLGPLFGDRILFVAHGTVIAGVDLEKLSPDDLRVEAEVLSYSLDNEESYIYDRETGVFTRGNQNLETEARQAAEQEILNAALEDGILDQAQANAESYMLRLLLNLGFPEVIFEN